MTSAASKSGSGAEPQIRAEGAGENRMRPAPAPTAASRPERVRFEETKHPDDFLRWLNAYTNTRREGDDELHALCSWAHTVINALHFGWPE